MGSRIGSHVVSAQTGTAYRATDLAPSSTNSHPSADEAGAAVVSTACGPGDGLGATKRTVVRQLPCYEKSIESFGQADGYRITVIPENSSWL